MKIIRRRERQYRSSVHYVTSMFDMKR